MRVSGLWATSVALLAAVESTSASATSLTAANTQESTIGRRNSNFVVSAASGGFAAGAATVVFHPVDTAKTLLQRGTRFGALRSLGARGLYRGVMPAAASMVPACAVRMGAYEGFKRVLLQYEQEILSPGALIFLASALSVVVSCSVRSPLDMIKTQVQGGSAANAADALRVAWGAGGTGAMRRFYTGAGLALMRDVPFFSINLLLYEQLRARAVARAALRGEEISPLDLVIVGALAQGIGGLVTNPVDVLKTRVQVGGATSVAAAFRATLRDGGPAAFMRGAGMRVVWIAPQGCIYYPAYEFAHKIFERRAGEDQA